MVLILPVTPHARTVPRGLTWEPLGAEKKQIESVARCSVALRDSSAQQLASGEDLLDDAAIDIGQAEIASGVSIGQPPMIEAEQVEDRRVQVVNVHFIDRCLEPEIVGLAIADPTANAAPGHPHRKAMMVMVPPRPIFRRGGPTKFAAPDD